MHHNLLHSAPAFLPNARQKASASVLMQRLSYQTETVLSNKITRNRIVLSFKDSPRKPLGRRPKDLYTLRHPFTATFRSMSIAEQTNGDGVAHWPPRRRTTGQIRTFVNMKL